MQGGEEGRGAPSARWEEIVGMLYLIASCPYSSLRCSTPSPPLPPPRSPARVRSRPRSGWDRAGGGRARSARRPGRRARTRARGPAAGPRPLHRITQRGKRGDKVEGTIRKAKHASTSSVIELEEVDCWMVDHTETGIRRCEVVALASLGHLWAPPTRSTIPTPKPPLPPSPLFRYQPLGE